MLFKKTSFPFALTQTLIFENKKENKGFGV